MKTLITILLFCLCLGCASPYQERADMLLKSYQAGEIPADQFHARMNELEMLENKRRSQQALLGMALIQQEQSNMWRNQMNRPQILVIP